ncbi:MAG: hypothetical protein JWQ25_3239 [Daejeonella sp.]|nr:hypothetical protein [Daejeonella sp.]
MPLLELMANDTIHVVMHEGAKSENKTNSIFIIAGTAIIIIVVLFNWGKIKRFFGRIRPSEYAVNISGFGLSGTVQYTTVDQECAWKIYIELITRVSTNELKDGTGILRESLNSLYNVFTTLRKILKNSGAELAKTPADKNKYTVASLLLIIMNKHLRPFLSKWHPLLLEHEQKKETVTSQFTHESNWEKNGQFRSELKELQAGLEEYINTAKDIAEGKR